MAVAQPDPPAHQTTTIDDEGVASSTHAHLGEEHRVVGPYGDDELEATDERGRRWYHRRPEPRRRYDYFGLNYTWWIGIWFLFILIVFLPWGRGWGY